MKLSFLCPDKVRKISVASYMWFLDMILANVSERAWIKLVPRRKCPGRAEVEFSQARSLVHVVSHERRVEEESQPLSGEKEAEGEEGVGDHLGEDELERRRQLRPNGCPGLRRAGAQLRGLNSTHLVELVAEVDGVDVVCASGQPSRFEEAGGVRSDPPHSRSENMMI
jgi:hypothetical protein